MDSVSKSATRIQSAWRGFQGRRRAHRTRIQYELSLVPPLHGFPGGSAYHALALRVSGLGG